MANYKITFAMELAPDICEKIANEFGIPTQIGTIYVEAGSPHQAMGSFSKKYNMKYRPVLTGNILKTVYVVRNEDNTKAYKYRLRGLVWDKDFNFLVKSKIF